MNSKSGKSISHDSIAHSKEGSRGQATQTSLGDCHSASQAALCSWGCVSELLISVHSLGLVFFLHRNKRSVKAETPLCKLYLPSIYMEPGIEKERMLGNYAFVDDSNSKYIL